VSARIVVAEDSVVIRRMIVFILERRGYIVLEASDGDTALALVRAERPDAVVLDVVMPGLSGLEVAEAMAADAATADIPVLILSALAQATEIEAGLASGARMYLTKPFEPQELAACVAKVLASRRDSTDGGTHD
jgi:CheY-like chemotaxis protein